MKFNQSTFVEKFVQTALVWCALLFVLLLTTQARAGYLYVLNDSPAGNTVYGYSVNETTGALTPISGSPVATGGTGTSDVNYFEEQLTIDRLNNRLYVINDGSNTVSAYSINPANGALTPLPFSPITLPAEQFTTIAVHPSGSPLIISEGVVSFPYNPSSYSFVITPTTAVAAPGSPYSTGDAFPFSSAFSQDGAYFYTGGAYTGGPFGNKFAGFSVNQTTGVLTALPGSPFNYDASTAGGFATDAQNRLFMTHLGPSPMRAYQTAGGVPTPAASNPDGSGIYAPSNAALHPSGNFYVAVGSYANKLASFQIAGSGTATTLTPVAGSPFDTYGSFSNTLVFNEAGTFLFVGNGDSRNITVFSFDSTSGSLQDKFWLQPDSLGTTGLLNGMDYLPVNIVDGDGDGVPDTSDNCPTTPNADQLDTDSDGQGNACDADDDGDGVPDAQDAFPFNPNESADTDGDGIGNNADTDDDGDGEPDASDNCPLTANPGQDDMDNDGIGDVCDSQTIPICFGKTAAITDNSPGDRDSRVGYIRGSSNSDVIIGTNNAEQIEGAGGDDRICSFGGADTITDSNGNDRIDAGSGDDTVTDTNGNDTIIAGRGSDTVNDTNGNDTINGGAGDDTLNAGDGNDVVLGGAGNDQLVGGNGNDTLDGGDGDDTLSGGEGNDQLSGGTGNDTMTGGLGGDCFAGGAGNDAATDCNAGQGDRRDNTVETGACPVGGACSS